MRIPRYIAFHITQTHMFSGGHHIWRLERELTISSESFVWIMCGDLLTVICQASTGQDSGYPFIFHSDGIYVSSRQYFLNKAALNKKCDPAFAIFFWKQYNIDNQQDTVDK